MNLPNYITLFRIFLVPFFLSFLIYYNPTHSSFRLIALGLFLIAVCTDGLDGLIARRFHKQTKLGTFLDPIADKVLLLSAFLGTAFSSAFVMKPPMWVVIVIVFRDCFIIGGLVIIYFTTNQLTIKPNLLGKFTTFFQIFTIISIPLSLFTVSLTIASTIAYFLRGIRLINAVSS